MQVIRLPSDNMYEIIILDAGVYRSWEIYLDHAARIGDLSKVRKDVARGAEINANDIIIDPRDRFCIRQHEWANNIRIRSISVLRYLDHAVRVGDLSKVLKTMARAAESLLARSLLNPKVFILLKIRWPPTWSREFFTLPDLGRNRKTFKNKWQSITSSPQEANPPGLMG